jgi:hypothetical protein
VRPSLPNSAIFARHRRWNSASPTARHLVHDDDVGSKCAAIEKARRRYIPEL